MSPRDEIVEAIGSVSRFKILAAMAKDPEEWWAMYALQKETSIRRTLLRDSLSRLASCEWIEAQGITNARRFRFNVSNPRAASFLRFLRDVDYFSET